MSPNVVWLCRPLHLAPSHCCLFLWDSLHLGFPTVLCLERVFVPCSWESDGSQSTGLLIVSFNISVRAAHSRNFINIVVCLLCWFGLVFKCAKCDFFFWLIWDLRCFLFGQRCSLGISVPSGLEKLQYLLMTYLLTSPTTSQGSGSQRLMAHMRWITLNVIDTN